MSFSPILSIYRGATVALGPLAPLWLDARARAGKEDAERLGERYGRYSDERPDGALVWLHGASVGEAGVALQIADAIAARDANVSFLISTGTRTSAQLAARRASSRTRHVFAPIDRSDAVRRFLAHWRPDLGVFIESEVWPNLILKAKAAGVRLALANARMSPKTLAQWRRWKNSGETLFRTFDVAFAADKRTAEALSALRGEPIEAIGNLKLAAEPPPVDERARTELELAIGARPLWLAASTHAGEESALIAAHAKVREAFSDALLIIAPRHPERGAEVSALAAGAPRRSQGAHVGGAPIYVADTLGELGTLYTLAPISFIAGSLLPSLKGHNPIEPAKLGSAILTGPYVESFEDVFDDLFKAGGADRMTNPDEIAAAVATLWGNPELRLRRAQAASAVVEEGAPALHATVSKLCALLPQASAQKKAADASA